MIKHFESVANLPGFGENDIEEMLSGGGMDKMLEYMMEALATKDYLYEPMKEFAQKVGIFYLLDEILVICLVLYICYFILN